MLSYLGQVKQSSKGYAQLLAHLTVSFWCVAKLYGRIQVLSANN